MCVVFKVYNNNHDGVNRLNLNLNLKLRLCAQR